MTSKVEIDAIQIIRLADLPPDPASRRRFIDGIDAIFWETAARPVTDPHAREIFRNLWLADYLRDDLQHVWLALTPTRQVVGYLVGCSTRPLGNTRFASLFYFEAFAAALEAFPAHLHINLDAAYRDRGIGGRLIDAFANQVRSIGLEGIHVVTAATARNVRFYTRNGFAEIARTAWKSGEVVFLGRTL